uniref:Olfactory receptor n=1 Tax=Leptobrachium leishanense TaxID=445787 RepID=A0A8C5WHV2_9ANUR
IAGTNNGTFMNGFLLLGINAAPLIQKLFFAMSLFLYILTVLGNTIIIFIIRLDSRLHSPMYFFLVNLSFIDILYTTTIIPNSLKNFIWEDKSISFFGCFVQLFFFVGLGSSECVLLSAMGYDRYVAICHPLSYSRRMSQSVCLQVILFSWTFGFLNSLVHTVCTASLPFCKERTINHFFCDIPPLMKLSCRDTKPNELVSLFVGGAIIVGSLVLIIISYICIIKAVLSISKTNARHKTFSTCGSHLTVVSIFFGTVIITYLLPPSTTSSKQNQFLSMIYGIVTPLINPIIYSFRNKDFQKGHPSLFPAT